MSELCGYCLDQLDGVIADGFGSFGLCEGCGKIPPDELTRIVTQRKAEREAIEVARKFERELIATMLHDDVERLEKWRTSIDASWKPKD